jgi:hypothetical protein
MLTPGNSIGSGKGFFPSIVTSVDVVEADENEFPETAPVPVALPAKLTVPADPAV